MGATAHSGRKARRTLSSRQREILGNFILHVQSAHELEISGLTACKVRFSYFVSKSTLPVKSTCNLAVGPVTVP
jgi:hypothetical protein